MDGGAWWATVHGVEESQTQLRDWAHTSLITACWEFFPFSFLLFYFAPFIPKCIAPEHFFNTDAIFLPSGPADEQQSYNQTIGNWQAQSMYRWLLSPQWFAVFSSYKPGPLRNTFSLKGNTTLLSEWHSISFPLAVFLSSHSHLLFPIHVVHFHGINVRFAGLQQPSLQF